MSAVKETTGNGIGAGQPGPGRPAGVPNRVTTKLKDAILQAAEETGEDGQGKDGLIGYLKRIALDEPKSFAGLLGRVLPLQLTGKDDGPIEVKPIDNRKLAIQIAFILNRALHEQQVEDASKVSPSNADALLAEFDRD